MTVIETLMERASIGAPRVDRNAGVIRGVKVLGRRSTNNRTYTEAAIAKALHLYDGAVVNIDHARDPGEPRSYRDRIGTIRNPFVDAAGGITGDFHFNKSHPLAEQLANDAEYSPESLGLSHNVKAEVARRGGTVYVESINTVRSVDIVADPATTSSLFESRGQSESLRELTTKQVVGLLTEGRIPSDFDSKEFAKQLLRG